MQSRKWIVVLVALFLFLVGGYQVAFRRLRINERATSFATELVSRYAQADVTLQSVLILPFSIRVNGIEIRFREHPLTITASRVRIGLDPVRFLLSRFSLIALTDEVIVDHPIVTWDMGVERAESDSLDAMEHIRTISFDTLPRIRCNVTEGEVRVQRADSSLVVADHIGGWVDGLHPPMVSINIQARTLADSINTTIKGTVNSSENLLVVDIVGNDYQMVRPRIGVLTGDLSPKSGTLDITAHLTVDHGVGAIAGTFALEKGAFDLATSPVGVTDITVRGRLENSSVFIDTLTGSLLGSRPSFYGYVSLKDGIQLDIRAAVDSLDLGRALAVSMPDSVDMPEGSVSLTAEVTGSLHDLRAHARVNSPGLFYRGEMISDIAAEVTFDRSRASIDSFTAIVREYRLNGTLSLQNPSVRHGIHAYRLSCFGEEITGEKRNMHIVSDGTVDTGTWVSEGLFTLGGSPLETSLEGSFAYHDKVLSYHIGTEAITLDGEATDLGGNPSIAATLSCSNLHLDRYLGLKDSLRVDGTASITGTRYSLDIETGLKVVLGASVSTSFHGVATVVDPLTDGRSITANGQFSDLHLDTSAPLVWTAAVFSDTSATKVTLVDTHGATLAFAVSHATKKLTGVLNLTDLPLEWIIDIFDSGEINERALLNGQAVLGGTVDEPEFATLGPVQVTAFSVSGLDRLSGETAVTGNLHELRFSGIRLRRDANLVVEGDGVWISGSPFVLKVRGEGVPLAAIGDVISDDRTTDGRVVYQAELNFTRKRGDISGRFEVTDGHFLDVPFDRASATFGGGSEGFTVRNFAVEDSGVYRGTGSATSGYFWRDANETPGLRMQLNLTGDLLRTLPGLTTAIKRATGQCTLDITMGGTWQEPQVIDGRLVVTKGTLWPAFLVDEVTEINADLLIDPDYDTGNELTAVRIQSASGMVSGQRIRVRNIHPNDTAWESLARPGMITVSNEMINLDFGILTGVIDRGKSRDAAVKVHVPGFMSPEETGMFTVTGLQGNQFVVGAADTGDHLSAYVAGTVTVLAGDIHYPLLTDEDGESSGKADEEADSALGDIFWDVTVNSGANVNYINESNLELGWFAGTTLWRNEVKIDPESSFQVQGRLSDGSFRVTGLARSTYGSVIYYGYRFDIDYAELQLDSANESRPCMITGRARTIVYDDSTGVENEIFLHLDFVDRESGQVTEARGDYRVRDATYYDIYRPQTRFDAGPLGIIEIRFSSNNPLDDTQERILMRLGLATGKIGAAAARAITSGIDNYYFNRYLRPFEERVKRTTSLDIFRITPSFLSTLAQKSLSPTLDEETLRSDTILYERSQIMVGEYIRRNWLLTYTVQYGVGRDFLSHREWGFMHDVGIHYSIQRNFQVQGRYTYDDIINLDDKRVEFRFNFLFD